MKFVFIAKHRSIWPVAWLCNALGVSRSGFHAWLNRAPAPDPGRRGLGQQVRQALLPATGPMAHAGSGMTSWRRASCGLHRIERLMKEKGFGRGLVVVAFQRTTGNG